eukprot:215020-Chlamydomonas_euryale.AAC.3
MRTVGRRPVALRGQPRRPRPRQHAAAAAAPPARRRTARAAASRAATRKSQRSRAARTQRLRRRRTRRPFAAAARAGRQCARLGATTRPSRWGTQMPTSAREMVSGAGGTNGEGAEQEEAPGGDGSREGRDEMRRGTGEEGQGGV